MARPRAPRPNSNRILNELRVAARRGDRAALTLAVDQMRTLALSPRYWEKYLVLLRNPLARLVDLMVIKQGDRIAHQKGWKRARPAASRSASKKTKAGRRPRLSKLPGLEQLPFAF